MVGGSVEDERCFSNMNFVKRNRLDQHLELCIRMRAQRMFTLDTFPLAAAVQVWQDRAEQQPVGAAPVGELLCNIK